jgi:hypothetical protein
MLKAWPILASDQASQSTVPTFRSTAAWPKSDKL